MDKKQGPSICCQQETHFRRNGKNIFHAHRNEKKTTVAILISDKHNL